MRLPSTAVSLLLIGSACGTGGQLTSSAQPAKPSALVGAYCAAEASRPVAQAAQSAPVKWQDEGGRIWATRGGRVQTIGAPQVFGPVDITWTARSQSGDVVRSEALSYEQVGNDRFGSFTVTGEVATYTVNGEWRGTDLRDGTLLWRRPLLETRVKELVGEDVQLEGHRVSVSATEFLVLAVTPRGSGPQRSVFVRVDVLTGEASVESEVSTHLRSLIVDERGRLYAQDALTNGVAAFNVDGSQRWTRRCEGTPVAAFDGRVYLSEGGVLDSENGNLLFPLERPPVEQFAVTCAGVFVVEPCTTSPSEICTRVTSLSLSDGTLNWSRSFSGGGSHSNVVFGAKADVSFTATKAFPNIDPFGDVQHANRTIRWTAAGEDRSDADFVKLDANADARSFEYFRSDRVAITKATDSYGNYEWAWMDAEPNEEGIPEGWFGTTGSFAHDFRPFVIEPR